MNSPTEMVWVEKYRPQSLTQVAMDPEQKNTLLEYVSKGEIPHLLFAGPPGCGKTTVAKILISSLDTEVMALNASKDRGIDMIRDRVGTFAKCYGMKKWKTVFFDEGDGLTGDAQNALRNLMEDYYEQVRFIFTANAIQKIIGPIQSRCALYEFGAIPMKERVLALKGILEKEEVQFDLPTVLGYAERYKDMRRMITTAQKSVLSNKGKLGPASAVAFSGVDLLGLVFNNDWNGLVKCASDSSFDHRQALTNMFWALSDPSITISRPAEWRAKIAKAVDESVWVPDQVVHFLGTCAELLSL
jgi:replication factor C small subunit